MAATQAALDELDELDDATLDLVLSLQLEDAATLVRQHNTGQLIPLGLTTISKIYTDELLQYRTIRQLEGEETKLAEASVIAAFSPPPSVMCVSCEDVFPAEDVWQSPCSHRFCVGCLEQLHRASMTDKTLYPPSCCRLEMPWTEVSPKLDADLTAAFEAKKEELDTDVEKRTYCSDTACAKFIGAAHIIHDIATCPACSEDTCTMCKSASHDGDCPADAALQETLSLAEDSSWQRCSRCGALVDRTYGCNHIT
jgi:hypothetical protein